VDIGAFFRGLTFFDLFALLVVAGGVVLGFAQGPVRRIVGIAVANFTLLLALNLRAPIGSWLAQYWTQDTLAYCEFVAFGASFAILFVTASLGAQLYVKPVTLLPGRPVANEVLGGVLGAVEAIVVLGAVILIVDSYFRAGIDSSTNELGVLRSFFRFYDDSMAAHVYRDWLIPAFATIFGWFIPESVGRVITH
jgi:uncharacterized membrane protein required for colicin V production